MTNETISWIGCKSDDCPKINECYRFRIKEIEFYKNEPYVNLHQYMCNQSNRYILFIKLPSDWENNKSDESTTDTNSSDSSQA